MTNSNLYEILKFDREQLLESVENEKSEKSQKLEEVWKDFNENGTDVGPYDEDDEDFVKIQPRRKSKSKPVDVFCSFCKNNGRPMHVYNDHTKTDCPVLKKYKCPTCGIKGHTRRYCLQKPTVEMTDEVKAK